MKSLSRSAPTLAGIFPGALFRYRGRPRWYRPAGWHLGQVVGLEPEGDVVHVATLSRAREAERLVIDVAFMPMTARAFEWSLKDFLETEIPRDQSVEPLLHWRRREREAGDVGAFSVPIWEAEELAWITVRDSEPAATRESTMIEYAFPRRNSEGRFRTLEVGARERQP